MTRLALAILAAPAATLQRERKVTMSDSIIPAEPHMPGTAYFRDGRENIAIESAESCEQVERLLEPRTQDPFILGLIWNLVEHVQARDRILSDLGVEPAAE